MKVAHFTSGYPVLSETFVRDEISGFEAIGCRNAVVSIRPKSSLPLAEKGDIGSPPSLDHVFYPEKLLSSFPLMLGGPLNLRHIFGFPGERNRNLFLKWVVPGIVGQLQHWGVDHCHAHFAHYPATLAWACARRLGVGLSFNAHSYDLFHYRSFLHEKAREAKQIYPISTENKNYLQTVTQLGDVDLDKMKVIHCGIDLSQYPYNSIKPVSNQSPKLVAVGRLVDTKGFSTLLQALPPVLQRYPDLRVEIVGEGPERESLIQESKELEISKSVDLLGALDRGETRKKQSEAIMVVQPCCEGMNGLDGIPVVLMEAMALGTIAISTRFAAIPELIEDGVNGILAPPKDATRLSEAILRVLNGDFRLEEMRLQARKTIEDRFDGPKNYREKATGLINLIAHPPS